MNGKQMGFAGWLSKTQFVYEFDLNGNKQENAPSQIRRGNNWEVKIRLGEKQIAIGNALVKAGQQF